MQLSNCPICDRGNVPNEADFEMRTVIDCPVCGQYAMHRAIAGAGFSDEYFPNSERFLLSGYLRHRNPALPIEFLDNARIQELAESLPRYTVPEKQDIFLRLLEFRTPEPGRRIEFDSNVDYPLIWAASPKEVGHHISGLVDRGLISFDKTRIRIEYKGWDYLSQLSHNRATSMQCFVAMWFHQSMNDAWENGIRPAVTDAGYRPRRVDDEPHVDRIDHRIIRMIRESRFLVADVTEHRQGVYFEAGFALALDMPVIWTCRHDNADEIHFDTRQFNHIIWNEPAELRTQLHDSIQAVIV